METVYNDRCAYPLYKKFCFYVNGYKYLDDKNLLITNWTYEKVYSKCFKNLKQNNVYRHW